MVYPIIDVKRTGYKIRQLRKEREISVYEICEYMGGISEQAVYKWERGQSLPSVDNLFALSRLFEVHMDDIVEEASEASSVFLGILKTIWSMFYRNYWGK